MIGSVVGNYRIVDKLGDGGMGAVYRAVDQMLDREVAIKVLRPELARNAALIERFRQEAIALARLNHPRIATLHGLEKHGDSLLMIMEYVRGDTLEAIVQRSGQLAWTRAAELVAATLDALDHAHDKGVVHRDIKPANIMLANSGAVKVMDFGIARLMGQNRQTKVGHAVGTPTYMAPEQLRGEEVDGRTDLYATGAVLFELVTGRMAFEADSDYALMMMQLNSPPPAASALVVGVPSVLDDIIARAMAKRREDRFPNANAFREALEEAVVAFATPARRTPVPAETRLAAPTPAAAAAAAAAASGATPINANDSVQDTTEHGVTPAPGVGETRLAPPSGAPASGAPETRLVDEPARGAAPATRLAPEPPATRLGEERISGHGATSSGTGRTGARAELLRDWRTFAIAGALLIAAGLGVRILRPAPDVIGRSGDVTADSSTVAAIGPGPNIERTTDAPAPPVRGEDASSLIINPPPARGAETPRPPRVDPAPVNRGGGDAGRGVVRPPAGGGEPAPPPRQNEPVNVVGGNPTPPDEPTRPVTPPEESESEAQSAISAAIGSAAAILSGDNTSAAGALLGGTIQQQWIALMKEGRVSISPSGAPDVQRRGTRASADFAASVNVRSPFGANRRQNARFTAELQRSGGVWRVVSLRPVGGLELK